MKGEPGYGGCVVTLMSDGLAGVVAVKGNRRNSGREN
jgi:hypothetical protein